MKEPEVASGRISPIRGRLPTPPLGIFERLWKQS